jgi:hypothetical protein
VTASSSGNIGKELVEVKTTATRVIPTNLKAEKKSCIDYGHH